MEYAKYLIYQTYINTYTIRDAFQKCCEYGRLEMAQWLIKLDLSNDCIDLNYADIFRKCCARGDLEMAKWLIRLGESDGYAKINIHAMNEYAFVFSCVYGHLEMAKWLIKLGESDGYTKINIFAQTDHYSVRDVFFNEKKHHIARWLIELVKTGGYGAFDKYLIDMVK